MASAPIAAGTVIVVGSANLDLVATTERHPLPGETLTGTEYSEYPGGKGLNQAVASSRSGSPTSFICALGADDAGRFLHTVAINDGIDLSGARISETTSTGRALIVVDEHGENTIIVIPGSNAECPPALNIDSSDVVLAQLEVPISTVIDSFTAARAAGARTILNPAPATALDRSLLALCDIVVPNEHEVELLGGVAALQRFGVEIVIVTRGSQGIDVHQGGATTSLPSFTVNPVDTTGAGDAFCGTLAASLAAGCELNEACQRALAAGALATTKHGAVPSLPFRADIEALISSAS
ncbi:MAG: ribokinase [Ilumatobacteraceae bacterium]